MTNSVFLSLINWKTAPKIEPKIKPKIAINFLDGGTGYSNNVGFVMSSQGSSPFAFSSSSILN